MNYYVLLKKNRKIFGITNYKLYLCNDILSVTIMSGYINNKKVTLLLF